MQSYWYDIIIEDINHYPFSSSWYSRHHQANHHFINRSKGGLLSNLLGACTETSAPDFVCHQKLLTAEIQDQERTKDPNKTGFLKDLGCIDRSLVFFQHKKTMGRVWLFGSMDLYGSRKFHRLCKKLLHKMDLEAIRFAMIPMHSQAECCLWKKSFTSLDLVWKGVGWQKKCLIMI